MVRLGMRIMALSVVTGAVLAPGVQGSPPAPGAGPVLPGATGTAGSPVAAPAVPDRVAAPETLEQAWDAALQVDQQLKARRREVSSAEHSLRASRAERWPTLGVDSSYTVRSDEPAFRFRFPAMSVPDGTFPFAESDSFAFGANVNLPLYTGGRIRHGIDAADADLASSVFQRDVARADLKMAVAAAYVSVLRAQRDLAVTQSTVRSLDSHVHDVEKRFQCEQVPRNDLLAARVALSNARHNALRSANAFDLSRATYNRQLGRPLAAPVSLAERAPALPNADLDALSARAVGNRPEIALLASRAEGLRHQAAAVRATSLPQVEMRGEYSYEENRYREPEGIAAAGVGVRWTLFDAGRDRQRATALSHKAEAVLHQKADLESAVRLEVRRAWLDVQEARARVEVAREAVVQADENLRVARRQYSLGVGTNTEVLDAETLRTQSYRNFYASTYELVLAGLALRRSTGDL